MKAYEFVIVASAFVFVFVSGLSYAQAQPSPQEIPTSGKDRQILTNDQIANVKTILSGYTASSLTADQARAINEAFRGAGLRNGPALRDAIKHAGFDPEALGKLAPPPGQQNRDTTKKQQQPGGSEKGKKLNKTNQNLGDGGYSLEQAISDRAQLTTIAFDGLAFMTGEMECATFLPPGKISDFFGFQYMRDVDKGELGHNTSFLTRIANNTYALLTTGQKQQLIELAKEQESSINELAYKRFPLVKAFYRLRDGDIPKGTTGLNRDAINKYSADIYVASSQLAYRRAQVLGAIVRSFTDTQKAAFKKLVFGDSRTWPEMSDQFDRHSLSHSANVAVMTYASELFSWYAGSVEADAYFCPEGHGTYFGAFYMKDMPAMGNPNYSISTTITGNNGEQFLAALSSSQQSKITELIDLQKSDLDGIVNVRRSISALLRQFMITDYVSLEEVLSLARQYGEFDGDLSYHYATAFSTVYKTLTAEQKVTLAKLRNLDKFKCTGAFLYSQPIKTPEIPNTNFLFGSNKVNNPLNDKTLSTRAQTAFALASNEVSESGLLPEEFTCDGNASTLPIFWKNVPAGTQSFAVIMHHIASPTDIHWYWILYNIPPNVNALAKNISGIGKLGSNSVNRKQEYAPPCSKGPGPKTYTYTVYALSSVPAITAADSLVSRAVLLNAIKGTVLDSSVLNVVYSRTKSAVLKKPK